ncbi:MAG: hypothetical protein HKN79_03090 [Flavobacteriales bacterium]|nr:hypothetical protein [Flavobacteriales bacterium]
MKEERPQDNPNKTYSMEKNKHMKRIVCILGLGGCVLGMQAQYDQEIISIGDRTLTVDAAFKISDLPHTLDSVYQTSELEYQLMPRQVEVTYEPKEIKAAKLKVIEPLTKLYRGYAKAGVGLYTTPLLEVHYNSIRNRDWAYGIDLRHFSSQGGLKDVADNAYGENHFGAWAKKYVNKHTLEGGLSYDLDRIHYYGFDPGDVEIGRGAYRQDYRTFKGYFEVESHYRDSAKVQHRGYVDVRNTKADIDVNESNYVLGGEAAKTIDDYRFGIKGILDINSFDQGSIQAFYIAASQDSAAIDLEDFRNTIFRLEPSIHARKGDLTVNIGLGIAVDGGGEKTIWHLYPQAYLSYSLFDDLFTPYAGLTGGLQRNSFYSLSQENPFIHNANVLMNTSKDLELYAGIRGTIFDNLGFNARVSVENYDDFAFYVNDTLFSAENKFAVLYDDLRVVRVAGELTYIHDERLTLAGRLEFASNTADDFEEAFNLPGVQFTLDGRYDLDDRFVVKAQVFAVGKRFGGTMMPGENDEVELGRFYPVELRSYVDGSLGLEYRYTKRISAWLDFNNLTGGRYPRWHAYPVQSVLVMGGLSYSF